MAERFTVPSRDRMEWLSEPGPSADYAHGHIAGSQSGGTRAPPASSQKNASPRLVTDGLDFARSVGGCAMKRSFTEYVWRKLKPALSGVINRQSARLPTQKAPTQMCGVDRSNTV